VKSSSFVTRVLPAAVGGFLLAAAIAAPVVLVTERAGRIALAAGLAVAVALAAGFVAYRLRRRRDETREKYRTVLETSPVVTWMYEPSDRAGTRYVSPQLEALTGYTPKRWESDREVFAETVHPDDRERVTTELTDAAERGLPADIEYRLVARDGRVVWVRELATTVCDADGAPLYGLSHLVDVSERHRSDAERERALAAERAALASTRERQGRIDLLGASAQLLASSLDPRLRVQRVAELLVRGFADWCVVDLGEDAESLQRLAVAGSDRARAAAGSPGRPTDPAVRAVVERGESQIVPPLGEDENGSPDFLEGIAASSIVCVPIDARGRRFGALTVTRTAKGSVFGADDLALVADLAGRIGVSLDADRLVREVEERANASRVLAHVADGVLLVDLAGVVRLWNPAAERITGIGTADAVGRPAVEVISGWEDRADSVPVAANPDPGHREVIIPIETPDGERWVAVSGVEFFGGTVYAFRDLTEVRRLEELKSDFIATASHELRTPLAAIYGAAQTLLRHDFALDEGGRDRFLSLIADESERLSRIVNEILLANQLDAGRLDFAPEPFDPVELVDRVVDAARANAPAGISLEFTPVEPLAPVAADRDRVRQVLVNLIENAIKYSPDGGRIDIGVETNDDNALFSVSDEGLGIPREERAHIFEKFYRVDPQMSRGVGGTGLGLYICRELIDRMGGRISVDENERGGSTFQFDLPLAGRTEHAARQIPARVNGRS
jgi:two-component system, OmpR family, phosphate regulon sensor histidine kinase PhoR